MTTLGTGHIPIDRIMGCPKHLLNEGLPYFGQIFFRPEFCGLNSDAFWIFQTGACIEKNHVFLRLNPTFTNESHCGT